jgi:superfamily II DNA or RNA helicase
VTDGDDMFMSLAAATNVFADRVRCLRQLARTLRERHGVDAHVGDGATKAADFEKLKRRFCAREFPVLCLSRIGHEGHNLQTASVLVHLDPPWLPSGLATPRCPEVAEYPDLC